MLRALPEIEKRTRAAHGGGDQDRNAAAEDSARSDRTGGRLLGRSQGAVLRHHGQGADGVPEGERHLLVAGAQDARLGRHLLDFCFAILCKGCAACVTACGDHQALKMVQETEEVNAEHETGTAFLDLLPDTSQKFLGLYNGANPADSKTATLRNMLMVRTNYDALVAGDGACAGCGEKSVLRSIAAVTEAYMRPVFHAKSDRFVAKAGELEKTGAAKLAALKEEQPSRVRAAAAGHRAPGDGPGRRRREGHQGAHRGLRSRARHDHRRATCRSDRRGAADRSLQPQEPAAGRWTPGQRHERDGHGRAHRLQHGLRLDGAQQSASVSVDELALPGRRDRGLAHGRELHRRSRAPLGHSRAPGRHSAHPRKQA